jgi:Lrp/AsnC family transcriptional regulator for asnA, asnC and gidA
MPAAKIAGELGIPESTVRHRLNRLVQRGVIQFTVLTNPLEHGYRISAMIQIQAELRRVRSIVQKLAGLPEVYFVGIMAGAYNIHAGAIFRSNEELVDFLTQRMGKIPGIVHTSTSTVLELVKRSWTFPFPAPQATFIQRDGLREDEFENSRSPQREG